MTMTSAGDRMPTIEIEITLAFARINPNTFAALSDEGHLFVSRELELLFGKRDVFCVHNTHRLHFHHRGHREDQKISEDENNISSGLYLPFFLCVLCGLFHPALVPFGTLLSGIASAGVTPSA